MIETKLRRQLPDQLRTIQESISLYKEMNIPLACKIHAWACSFLDHLKETEWVGREQELLKSYNGFLKVFLEKGTICEAARIAPNLEVLNPSQYKRIWNADPDEFRKGFMAGESHRFVSAKKMLCAVAKYARSHFPETFPKEEDILREEALWLKLSKEIRSDRSGIRKIFEENRKKSQQEDEARRKQRKRETSSWERMKSEEFEKFQEWKKTRENLREDVESMIDGILKDLEEGHEKCEGADKAINDLKSRRQKLENRIADIEQATKKARKKQRRKLLMEIAISIAAGYFQVEYLTWKV